MFVTFLKAMNNFSLLMRALRDEHKAKGWVFINPLSVLVTADELHWTTLCQLHYHLHVGNVPERFNKNMSQASLPKHVAAGNQNIGKLGSSFSLD